MGRVAEIADHPKKAWKVGVTLLTEDKPDCDLPLKSGFELFVVCDGQPIKRPGYIGPDRIYVMGKDLALGKWPVMLCHVRRAHAGEWAEFTSPGALNERLATRMVNRARAHLNGDRP